MFLFLVKNEMSLTSVLWLSLINLTLWRPNSIRKIRVVTVNNYVQVYFRTFIQYTFLSAFLINKKLNDYDNDYKNHRKVKVMPKYIYIYDYQTIEIMIIASFAVLNRRKFVSTQETTCSLTRNGLEVVCFKQVS